MNYQTPSFSAAGYGTTLQPTLKRMKRTPFSRSSTAQFNFNFAAIFIALFLPWLLFCFMSWTMSFSLHFQSTILCYCVVVLGFALVLLMGKMAVDHQKQRDEDPAQASQNWFGFLALTCLIAWSAGILWGDFNFFRYMEPFYSVANLNQYPQIDPAKMSGSQIMDAGKVEFIKGAHLERNMSMGFKNKELYCVTPIVSGKKPLESYDFWAIGTNCCRGGKNTAPIFQCGEWNNKYAHSGLRLMHDSERNYFRLAVQQAESAYGITARHPLFFHWMQDPQIEVNSYMDDGFKNFLTGLFTHFAFQVFCVVIALVIFARSA